MYKSRFLNKVKSKAKPQATSTPVYQPQESQLQASQGKENEIDIISSSQETTTTTINKTQTKSRFISQRQAILNATQQQVDQGKGLLEVILYNCGLEITDLGCELKTGDPISFTRKLGRLIDSKPEQQKRQYVSDFDHQFALTDEEKFLKSDKLMRGIYMADDLKQHQTQTSLVMCLLAIDCFKDDIVRIILARLKDYVKEMDDKAVPMIIGLVLAQFKFCDQILSEKLYNFMFEEFFAILKQTKTFECQEVIVQQFKDLEITKQEEAARRLIEIFQHRKQDLLHFLDIFCLMALDENTITEIFEIIRNYIEKDCITDQYLSMIKYSIHYSQTVEDIVYILRDQVKWEACSKVIIKDIFKIIGKSLIRDTNKTIDAWMKTIMNVNCKDDLRSIDFIMLLLIADTKPETNVKKITIDKITKDLFTEKYLKNSFETFTAIIPSVSQTLLELLDGLQKAKDNQTYNFLATCYKLLFRYSGEAKAIVGSLTNFLCEKKSNLPFAAGSNFKMTVLNILHEVCADNLKSAAELLYNHKILLRSLDISRVELTLNEHRSLMKLLSTLVFGLEYGKVMKAAEMRALNEVKESLSEHLNMVNSKYISNPETSIRNLGIIGAVKIIGALVCDKLESSEVTSDFVIPIEDMQNGPIKDAAKLVELILRAADENFEMLAMFYDEMSAEFKPNSNKPQIVSQIFLNWLGEKIFSKLTSLVTEKIEQKNNLAELNIINHLDIVNDSFENPDINIPIATMICAGNDEIFLLPSLFKLVIIIDIFRFGLQDSLNHLSGMIAVAISLPENFGTAADSLSEDNDTAKIQLDIYFLCINFFRELISGFLKSDDESIKKIMKIRLKQLISFEKHLNRLLQKPPPGYYPPLLSGSLRKKFESLTKEKVAVRPAKVAKNNESVAEPKKMLKIKSNQFAREMENEIVLLLSEKFELHTTRTDDEFLTLTQLIYILEDVHRKIENLFKPKSVEQKNFIDEMQAIKDLESSVLSHLVRNFEEINEQMSNAMEDDIEGESKVSKLSSRGFSMILELLHMIFSNKKLKTDVKLLNSLLKKLLVSDTSRLRSQESICEAIMDRYSKFADNVKELSSAVALVDFVSMISALSGEQNRHNAQIYEMTEHFLEQQWNNDGGSEFNANLEKLLSIYVNKAKTIDQIEDIVIMLEKFCQPKGEIRFPNINKSNVLSMIRVCLRRMSEIINATKSNLMTFGFWQKSAGLLNRFILAVKYQKSAMALNLFLKNILVFLKRFNSDGISSLKVMAREDVNKFVDLIKGMQTIRRQAHGATCELKHRNNKSISKILPAIRQQFEIFHLEVLEIVRSANISLDAVVEGPLKNFDFRMVDIFSQNTTAASDNDSDDEEESAVQDDTNIDDSVGANKDTSESEQEEEEEEEEENRFVATRSRSTIV